ncbi:hypothetical protein [Mesorhizobium sp.]|uniref:hypothetical protein n=1 Tax=Mesorhizobium sp. TaxID=1871066 RepID=UPI000FE4291C|nr:hypothetical protein [Mesorhizobium sp.]RWG90558.1 MAG: hypothetical protein EOQ70_05205 [Mesorhizobium sp.]RWK13565.1 MAG: hypothetical protein EOR41_32000 [Mesorhizobium sp.]
MDLVQIDRILNAVGAEHFPENLDRMELIRGLDLCEQWYREAILYSTRKRELLHEGRLAAISKTAKRLRLLLDDEKKAQSVNGVRSPLPQISETQELLGTLVKATERRLSRRETQNGPYAAYQRSFRKWSPFEWLVGRWLPLVYMEIGATDPGRLEALVAKNSPYVRFVSSVLTELDVKRGIRPYSRASIVKAVRLPFTGKVRRKEAGSAIDRYQYWRVQLLRRVMKPHLDVDHDQDSLGKITSG